MPAPSESRNARPPRAAPLCAAALLAAFLALPPAAHAQLLPVKTYTSADGLGSSSGFGLVRDPRGFIWVCTRDGLVRFDGYRFITYRIGDEEADPTVYDLLPTRGGVYWINLNRGTDYRLAAPGDDRVLEPLRREPAKNDPRVPLATEPVEGTLLPVFEDRDGQLWAYDDRDVYVVRDGGGGRLSGQRVELRPPAGAAKELVHVAFRQGRDGSVWMGTRWGLVRRLPGGKIIHYAVGPRDGSDPVYNLAEDEGGRIWLARNDGLLVLRAEPPADLAGLEDFAVRRPAVREGAVGEGGRAQLPAGPGEATLFAFADILLRDAGRSFNKGTSLKPGVNGLICASDGKVWAATNRGLLAFDGERFQHYTEREGLAQTMLSSVVEDGEGRIWISSPGGLMRLNPKGLTSYRQADGLSRPAVLSIHEGRGGDLHVVTEDWSVSRVRDVPFRTERPRLPPGATGQWHSNLGLLDSRGDWWFVTVEDIYHYAGVRGVEELRGRAPAALGLKNGWRLFEDSRGDVWVSTFPQSRNLGLYRWRRATGQFETFDAGGDVPASAAVASFAEDAAGTLWMGLNDGGLVRYREGRFTFFDLGDGLPRGMITSLHADRRGRLWVASSHGGVARVDDPAAERPAFHRYTISDGLASNNVRSVTEDLFGNIYLGTVRGVNRLSPETGRVRYYGVADGLAADFVVSAQRDRRGVLWFGTFGGLSRLVPEPDPPSPPPPILISGLRIAGVDYSVSPLGQTEARAPEQSAINNNLQIDYFSVGAGGAATKSYQYRLGGGEWSAPTVERSVTFANLAPGSYRFEVRAVNAEGAASEHPAVVSFTILRPTWQRPWFIGLALLLLASAAYALYRYRLAQAIKLERVRTRIATDLHDDIGASLSQIAILSEVVGRKVGGDGSTVAEPLAQIAGTSREMVDSMSDIVWAINPRRDHLEDLAQRMRRFADDLLSARDIALLFRAPDANQRLHLGADLRREVYLVFKEAVNNAAKYASCTRVEVKLRVAGGWLVLRVADDGRGFDPSATSNGHSGMGGHGLASMRRRAESLGGTLEVESAPGRGTAVTLKVPSGGAGRLRKFLRRRKATT